jgi:hypothetical protein
MTTKFHPVKDINKKKEIWRLAVILDDIWSVYKGDTEDHVEVLLRDVNVRRNNKTFPFMYDCSSTSGVSVSFSCYLSITILYIGRYYPRYHPR